MKKQILEYMLKNISINQITMLKQINKKIKLDKIKNTKIFTSNFGIFDCFKFIENLENDKIYIVVPILTINSLIDEPYIILSQQFLITRNSKGLTLKKFIYNKINECNDLYNINKLDNCRLLYKYKEVNININEDDFDDI